MECSDNKTNNILKVWVLLISPLKYSVKEEAR